MAQRPWFKAPNKGSSKQGGSPGSSRPSPTQQPATVPSSQTGEPTGGPGAAHHNQPTERGARGSQTLERVTVAADQRPASQRDASTLGTRVAKLWDMRRFSRSKCKLAELEADGGITTSFRSDESGYLSSRVHTDAAHETQPLQPSITNHSCVPSRSCFGAPETTTSY